MKYQYGAGAGKPYNLSDFKIKPAGELNYQVGDRLKHIKFGVGTVQEITKGGIILLYIEISGRDFIDKAGMPVILCLTT